MSDSSTQPGVFRFTLPVFLNFAHVIKPRAFSRNGKDVGEPKYDANLEIPNDSPDLKAVKMAALAVAKAKWPDKDFAAAVAAGAFHFPFTDGTKAAEKAAAKAASTGKESQKREYSRDRTILVARSAYPPKLAVLENGKFVDYEGERRPLANDAFYPGVQVLAEVSFSTYHVEPGIPGVNAYLTMLASLNRGTRVAGGRSAADTFSAYAGTVSDEDPTGSFGADEEPPF